MVRNKDISWIHMKLQNRHRHAIGVEKSILGEVLGLFETAPEFQIVMTLNDASDEELRQLLEGARHECVILPGGQEASIELLEPAPTWIPVTERLPENEKPYEEYLVNIMADHFPISTWDDDPYCEEYVTVAQFDDKQKIWYLHGGNTALNALITPEDSRVNSESVTHWMPMPAPPKED